MKRLFTLSVLIAALFTTIATNNIVKAQPASFTQDFLQEDYRNGEVVRTNVVTVVWDAETQLMTFYNFYGNSKVVANGMVNLPVYQYVQPNKDRTTINWESSTKGTFTWRVSYLGVPNIPGYTYIHSAVVSKMIYTQTPVQAINMDTYQVYNVNYKYDGGGNCDGTIDLDKGEITIDDPWGCCVGMNANYTSMGSTRVIEYFEYSKLTLIKTELVDIVNEGTVGEEYEVYDDLVGVATVDGVQSAPTPIGNDGSPTAFVINKGKYKLDLDMTEGNRSLTVSQTVDNPTPDNVDNGSYQMVYIMGEVNDIGWAANAGQPMVTTDGVHYSAVVEFDGRSNEQNYFSFSKLLSVYDWDWDYIASHRFGAIGSTNYPIVLGAVLFAKDMGKYKYPSVLSDGQDDFMGRVKAKDMYEEKVHPASDYDQSNWVMLAGLNNPSQFVGSIIKGKSIKGTLVDKVNPTIAVTSTPEQGDQYGYEPNLYIMPSFNEAYYSPNSQFFFVAPKVQEYAYITWACYNAADGNFYTMSDGNTSNLSGGIKVNWDYYPAGNPQDGYVYEFDAIVRKVAPATSDAPLLKDGNHSTPVTGALSADYMVYPLRLYDVPTAINTIDATGKVVNVKYYNLMGVESSTPFNGVNIVVTTYDNGSRITSKKLY